jgi:hypothetical protein
MRAGGARAASPDGTGKAPDEDIKALFDLTEPEREALSAGQQRARTLYLQGKTLKEAAKATEGTEGCSENWLKKLSRRYQWTARRKQIEAARKKTYTERMAERVEQATIEQAETDPLPDRITDPDEARRRHCRLWENMIRKVEESLPLYDKGIATETTQEVDRGPGKGQSSAGEKRKEKYKSHDGHTVGNLRMLARIAQIAVEGHRKAIGLDDGIDGDAARTPRTMFKGLSDEALKHFVDTGEIPDG